MFQVLQTSQLFTYCFPFSLFVASSELIKIVSMNLPKVIFPIYFNMIN